MREDQSLTTMKLMELMMRTKLSSQCKVDRKLSADSIKKKGSDKICKEEEDLVISWMMNSRKMMKKCTGNSVNKE